MGLSNSQYDSLMREYDFRRQDNAALSDERRRMIYESIPRIREIDDRIAEAAMSSFADRLAGREDSSLGDILASYRAEKKRLLLEAGYPDDYLDPIYDCPDCRDTGYIDGKKCHCLIQAQMDILYGDSHLGSILEVENFYSFSQELYSRTRLDPATGQSAYEAAGQALAAARGMKPGDNIILYGDPGTGKTFLSHCIAADWLSRMRSVIYVTAFTLTDIFSKRTFDKTTDAKREFDELFSCELLIIDDLGTEFANSFTQPMFFQCINERILSGRSTVISTNLVLPEIKDTYTERISSRLIQHYRFLHLFGDDIRIKKKISG